MSNGYLVISADCHAGPDSPVYREFLDPQYRDRFDEELAARDALMQQMRRERFGTDDDVFAGSQEFQEEWFGEDEDGNSLHELGLRGGWDAKKRDEELSADGVTGEVVFPGPDAVTGKMGAPFGAGFAIDSTADPELVLAGARSYNRWAAELCGQSPQRRAGLIVAPILADIDGAIAEITRAHGEGLWGGVIIPAQWGEYASYTNYRYDPIWELCESLDLPVHTHSGPAAHADYGAVPGVLGSLRERDGVVDVATAVVPPVVGRVRALPRSEDGGDRGRLVLGAGPAVAVRLADPQGPGLAQARRQRAGPPHDAPERVLRPQHQDRFVEHPPARAGPALRDRRRQHHVGQRLPAPRGHMALHQAHPRARRSTTSRSTRPSRSSGSTRPSSTASTSTRCSRSPTRSGPRPTTSVRPTPARSRSGTTCAPQAVTG